MLIGATHTYTKMSFSSRVNGVLLAFSGPAETPQQSMLWLADPSADAAPVVLPWSGRGPEIL